MVRRTTQADLKGMFERAMRAAKAVGIDPVSPHNGEPWRLEIGSKTYGISYKLIGAESVIRSGWGGGYLGMTAREAYDSLTWLATAWEAVADAREATKV